jgi:hypothetical protein
MIEGTDNANQGAAYMTLSVPKALSLLKKSWSDCIRSRDYHVT